MWILYQVDAVVFYAVNMGTSVQLPQKATKGDGRAGMLQHRAAALGGEENTLVVKSNSRCKSSR